MRGRGLAETSILFFRMTFRLPKMANAMAPQTGRWYEGLKLQKKLLWKSVRVDDKIITFLQTSHANMRKFGSFVDLLRHRDAKRIFWVTLGLERSARETEMKIKNKKKQ